MKFERLSRVRVYFLPQFAEAAAGVNCCSSPPLETEHPVSRETIHAETVRVVWSGHWIESWKKFPPNPAERFKWYFGFFFISGFCSVLYELIWLRLSMAQFGVTTPMI